MNKKDIKYLFIGDNILSDCQAPSKIERWCSIFIFDDINLKYKKVISSLKKIITKDNTIHIKCLFHFSLMIEKKLSQCGFFESNKI